MSAAFDAAFAILYAIFFVLFWLVFSVSAVGDHRGSVVEELGGEEDVEVSASSCY